MRTHTRPCHHEPALHLLEVVTPRLNDATLSPVEHLLAGLGTAASYSLEVAASDTTCRFLVRAQSAVGLATLRGQLGAAYPQAVLRQAGDDPAHRIAHEQSVACTLQLQEAPYLPLRL